MHSYWLSNFENDSTPGDLESRPTGSSGGRGWASDFFLGLDSMQVTLKPFTEPLFTQLKDLSLLEKYTKNQGASYNFRLGFALSNRPHLHRAYLVNVRKRRAIAVYRSKIEMNQNSKTRTTLHAHH